MLRALIVTFFLVTSYALYTDKGTQPGSLRSSAPVYLSTPKIIPSPEVKIVRTVAKPYTPSNRRFTNKEDIAQQRDSKALAQAKPSYLPQVQKRPLKKVLNAGNKYRIALHIKSELKRIGCFKGTISGSWGRNVHTALSHFNVSAAQNLHKDQPNLATLTALRDHAGSACNTKYTVASTTPHQQVHLPVARPQMAGQIATPFVDRGKPTIVASDDLKTEQVIAPNKVAPQTPYKARRAKKKKRKKARYTANTSNDFFNIFSYQKKKRRPQASLVGRRKQPVAQKKRARKAKRLRKARLRHKKMKRKKYALRKKHRRIRRRYRRARRRFGFSTTGELGYW